MKVHMAILGLLCVLSSYAQEIKVLPSDPMIKTEVMPNGLKCYVVSNPYLKGMADFSLVQNTGVGSCPEIERARLVEISRNCLSGQPRLLAESVQDFFTSLGAIAGPEGFVSVTDDATIYRFRNVNIATRKEALDSSLLVLMGVIENVSSSKDSFLKNWFAPSDHAIVVAGDVDAQQVMDKIRMLSYMVSASVSLPRNEHLWEDMPIQVAATGDKSAEVSAVSATWRIPRTSTRKMNTIQPLVLEKYMQTASFVAQHRIKRVLHSQAIPYAEVSAQYNLPNNHEADATFSIVVKTAQDQIHSAIRAISVTMSSIASGNVDKSELKDAILEYYENSHVREKVLPNSNYVNRCVASFLYNESLASDSEKNKFLTTRVLSEGTELSIFKSIAEASFKPDVNLSLNCKTTDGRITTEDLFGIFKDSWSENVSFSYEAGEPNLAGPALKIKMKSVRKEYLTGGSLWTLSNGMKVIVKPTVEKDVVHWAFISNRGYGHVTDVERGEAPYFSEFMDMCRIGGVKSSVFRNAVRKHGMTMDVNMSHSSTCFSGKVPDDGLEYLIRVLLTQMNDVVPDKESVEYRSKCEALRLSSIDGTMEAKIASIDSVLCPGYKYSSCRSGFSARYIDKAQALYRKISTNMDSGVLVLIGDIDEKVLKQTLLLYAGGFKTSGSRPLRPVVNYQPLSGTVELIRTGEENSVDMVLSSQISLTAEGYYAAEILSMCLRQTISHVITGRGMHVRMQHQCSYYPHERVSLMLSLREAPVEGFAPGTSHYEPVEALADVRRVLRNLDSIELTDSELNSYKALLKQKIKRRSSEPEFWYEVLSLRYVEGKDFYSSYESRIDAITKEDIKDMLRRLSQGARVEYVLEKE